MTAGPLSGIKVIDLTRVLAGPYCTMMLHDMGAEVIKVENPEGGDDARYIGPFVGEGDQRVSAYFASLNRGKKSIALNLKDDGDREVFLSLLKDADVLVENYRPGTMEKLGFGWDALHEQFPHLIMASVSGFGQTGPYKSKPAYDMVVQAMGGIMSVTGHPGGPPTRVGSSVGDIVAGMFCMIGVSTALYQRSVTGEARHIDVSMLDSQVAILENAIARYAALGEIPGPIGARHPSIAPFEIYPTSDGWVVIAAGNDRLFETLSGILERPDLPADPRFSSNAARTENVDALREVISPITKTRSTKDWIATLEAAGIPTGPMNNIEEVLTDPQVTSRNMVVSTEGPTGPIKMAGNPVKMSGMDDPVTRGPIPALDGHRDEILKDL